MPELTRRRFVGAAASAASLALLPASVQKALAATPSRTPRLRDIRHVVLLMQENRSFDHYFGTLSGVAGFEDAQALTLPGGQSVFQQPDPTHPDGFRLPFHLDTSSTSAQTIPSTDHSWGAQHAAWNNGRMDSWMSAHAKLDGANAPYVMGYYTRDDLPFHYALADAFTICDHYHSSALAGTSPNRLHWMTGTIDAAGKYGAPVTTNGIPATTLGWTTYPERLQKAGISWQVYQGTEAYGCDVLTKFAAFRHAKKSSPLYQRGIAPTPPGRFEHDARNDRLPAVSWIIPDSTECEHPSYLPAAGADLISRTIAALAANPDVWAKTVLIVNYDENDGLFDHVAPPTPPLHTPGEYVGTQPVGAGFRVPCIVVSPWTAGGWVASERFDHTSCLRFLERFTGVHEPNISAWRRATFGDLTSAFRFGSPHRTPPPLPRTAAYRAGAEQAVKRLPKLVPPTAGSQLMPQQESDGHRSRIGGR